MRRSSTRQPMPDMDHGDRIRDKLNFIRMSKEITRRGI